jgi:hypothetical protein
VRNSKAILILLTAGLLKAQSSPVPAAPGGDSNSVARWQMELFRQSVQDHNDVTLRQAAAARQEEIARFQFMTKANHFVKLWGDFMHRLNEQQTFDTKLAKKMSKAFHELETSDGWPLRDGGK